LGLGLLILSGHIFGAGVVSVAGAVFHDAHFSVIIGWASCGLLYRTLTECQWRQSRMSITQKFIEILDI